MMLASYGGLRALERGGGERLMAEKKISPKAPAGTGAKKSGAQAATRITKKVKQVKKVK